MLSRQRKYAFWSEKSLTPKLSLSMSNNVNTYIFHCHDDNANSSRAGNTGRISQTNSEQHPQKENTRRWPLLIILKKATAVTILSSLTTILQNAEVTVAISQEEQAVDAKKKIIKNDF